MEFSMSKILGNMKKLITAFIKANAVFHFLKTEHFLQTSGNSLNYRLRLQKQPFADVLQNVLKNFAIFSGKHLYRSLFLITLRAFKRDSNLSVFL